MNTRYRPYLLYVGLFVMGLVGGIFAAGLIASPPSRPAHAKMEERPPRPRPAVVMPANVLLPNEAVSFSDALALTGDSLLSTPPPPVEDTPAADDTMQTGDVPVKSTPVRAVPATETRDAHSETRPPNTPDPLVISADSSAPPSARTQREEAASSAQLRLSRSEPVRGSLGGLVTDETMTPQGRTFYSNFFGVWRSPPTTGFYAIRVQEKPTPGRGTLVQVVVNDDVTFQARLHLQTDIAEQALQAARHTYAYVRSGQGILRIY